MSAELCETRTALAEVLQSLVDLEAGTGEWRDTKLGEVARIGRDLEQRRKGAFLRANTAHGKDHRAAKRTLRDLDSKIHQAHARFDVLAKPHQESLGTQLTSLGLKVSALELQADERTQWLASHPATAERLGRVGEQLAAVDSCLLAERNQIDGIVPSSGSRDTLAASTRELLDRLLCRL